MNQINNRYKITMTEDRGTLAELKEREDMRFQKKKEEIEKNNPGMTLSRVEYEL